MPPIEMVVALTVVFVSVASAAGALMWWWMSSTAPGHRRLRSLAASPTAGLVIDTPVLAERPDPTLERLSRLVPKNPKELGRIQRRLTGAGYPGFAAAVYYSIAELVLPFLCGGTVLLLTPIAVGWIFAVLAAFVGYTLPGLFVLRKTAARQKAIQNGLPDALDLLVVSVEAGCGLEQAIVKASEELQGVHPALAEELRLVTTETRAGKPRVQALTNLAQRTGVPDVRTLVAMLTQTERFGTSVGQALRTHAETARTKRRQRAEERAAKVSVKLVFPLALCLFPALYVVCFGPVVVKVYRAWF